MRNPITEIRFLIAAIRHPKTLELTQDQAEAVQSLFLGGSSPEAIANSMERYYGRKSFDYFKQPNEARTGYDFALHMDPWLDGLEYIRAAMAKLGAIVIRKEGRKRYDYFQTNHPMVRKQAEYMAKVEIPKGGR